MTGINLIQFPTCVPGTEVVYATHREWPLPIGNIFYRVIMGNHVEILDCYVLPALRRKGVFKKLFARLREYYPKATFITQKCNENSEPIFVKYGFRKKKDGWWLES